MEKIESVVDSQLSQISQLRKKLSSLQERKNLLTNALVGLQQNEQKSTHSKKQKNTNINTLSTIRRAYRLTGISQVQVGGYRGARIQTSYCGKFFESFYIVFIDTEEAGRTRIKKSKVLQHTIPYFIPISQISETYLSSQSSEPRFISIIQDYLNAFVARREIWKETLEKYSNFIFKTSVSLSYDVLDFKCKFSSRRLHVTVKTNDLLSVNPDYAIVVLSSMGRVIEWEDSFCKNGVLESLKMIQSHSNEQ
eukprot:c207_g1_i1.p1 GENE.c207_g1_i1~~c207_g1_i1.p1  ORF type:complete len:265 (-),score=86.57 c207_g1_i1:29-781(-)